MPPQLPPLPDPRTDWLPAVIRFVIGALFGAPCGLVIAARHTTSDTLQLAGLIGGALLCGTLAAWLSGEFWRAIGHGHWSGWFNVIVSAVTAGVVASTAA